MKAGLAPAFVFLLSPLFAYPSDSDLSTLSHDTKNWLRLGHYHETLVGKYESEVDGQEFFLADKGKRNPEAELNETVRLFRIGDKKAVCRFPARYKILKRYYKELILDPLVICSDYSEFFKKMSAQSITLFFSSYYIDSPASIFGHTFLRLNKRSSRNYEQEDRILDYAINFSAIMDGSDVFTYALKGLTGHYQAKFFAQPFYYKVREYNDFESRDLWGYELDLSQEKVDLVVAHLWELSQTYFDYRFFTENCSYHILSLLEAIDPSLNLKASLPSFYIIPIDTVREVLKSLPVRFVEYRPSLSSKIKNRSKGLSGADKEIVKDVLKGNFESNKVGSFQLQAARVDAAIELFDLNQSAQLLSEDPKVMAERFKLVSHRADLDSTSQSPVMEGTDPTKSHLSSRVGVFGYFQSKNSQSYNFSHRFALHDLLDPLQGQPSFSQIEFMHTKVRFIPEENTLSLSHLDLFTLASFSPSTFYRRPFSWTARLGLRNIQDRGCVDCMAGHMELGGGASIAPEGSLSFVSLLSKLEIDYTGSFAGSGRALIGPEVWARMADWESVNMLLKTGYKWGTQFDRINFGQGLFTHSLELRYHATQSSSMSLKGEVFDEQRQALEVGLLHFF